MSIVLQSRTQITTLHKVKAHANINGNEQVDALAKTSCELEHRDAVMPHEHVHPTPYYLQKKMVAWNARNTGQRPYKTPWKTRPQIR